VRAVSDPSPITATLLNPGLEIRLSYAEAMADQEARKLTPTDELSDSLWMDIEDRGDLPHGQQG